MSDDVTFLDTETLGLHPEAPIWEFAAIKRTFTDDRLGWFEETLHIFIQHDPEPWIHSLAEQFAADYQARYDETVAFCERSAARSIATFLGETNVVACNPVFDDPRLALLLRRHGIEPTWHYHPDDISSLAKGFAAGRGCLPPRPWKSETLSLAIGVDPAEFERHTAMGDAQWVRAQYDAVMAPPRWIR